VGSWLGAGGATQPTQTASQLRVQTSLSGQPIPLAWGQNRLAGNLIWYGDFNSKSQGSAGKGGLFGNSNSVTYYASSIIALCAGPIVEVNGVFNSSGFTSTSGKGGKNSNTTLPNADGEIPLATMGYSLFDGDYAQEPWNYMTTAHPTQALAYRGVAYICQANQNLGSSPELPMINLDVIFSYGTASNYGAPDWNPADVVLDFLTNPYVGLPAWPAGIIGDPGTSRSITNGSGVVAYDLLSTYWNYCQALGLWVSPILTDARSAADFLGDLLKFSNSEAIFSQGLLRIVPYGDGTASGNGASYTPPQQQLFDIDDDDLISKDPDKSVEVDRVDVSQQLNDIRVTYLNRDFEYNPDVPMEAKDDAAILLYGLRPNASASYDFLCLPGAAQNSAQLMLQRQKITSTFKFTVDQSFIVLDPMDIVALYVPQLGLVGDGTDGQWVRIKEIQENPDFSLAITAEVYLSGTGSAPEFGTQPHEGQTTNFGVQPGNVNPPYLWEPTINLSGAMAVWCALSGAQTADWGGCQVWVSTDNVTYTQSPGLQVGPSRMGVLAAPLPTIAGGEDTVDTTNTLAVNLTESASSLASASEADAQALSTLCAVLGPGGIEYVAYANANAFAANEYDLTYLVRGAYGTSAVMNSSEPATGAPFARLDNLIFKIPYNQNQIGQKIYVKFLSFNLVGGQLQTLADVDPYTYTIVGLTGGLETIQNFAVTGVAALGATGQQVPAIQCTWTPIGNASVVAVVFEYYVAGQSPSQSTQVQCSNPEAGTFLILAGLQGNTTYEVRATIVTAPNDILPSDWTAYLPATTPSLSIGPGGAPGVPTNLTLVNTATVQSDGTVVAGVAAGWDPPAASPNLANYNVEFSTNGGTTWQSYITGNTAYPFPAVVGVTVFARVAAVSNLGAVSAFDGPISILVTGQTSPPGMPTNLTALGGFKVVGLMWVNPPNPDIAYVNVYANTVNVQGSSILVGYTAASTFAVTGAPGYGPLQSAVTYYFWVQAVNTSGVAGPISAVASATTGQVSGGTDIVAASIVADDIFVGTITGNLIAAQTIEANNIEDDSLTAPYNVTGSSFNGTSSNPPVAILLCSATATVTSGRFMIDGWLPLNCSNSVNASVTLGLNIDGNVVSQCPMNQIGVGATNYIVGTAIVSTFADVGSGTHTIDLYLVPSTFMRLTYGVPTLRIVELIK
jgi:hypothetical protein